MIDVVLLNGVVGAGKSTTADALSDLLGATGRRHAVLDLDALRRLHPAPAGDPFQFELLVANLSAVAANARRFGARLLVLAGVVEDREGRDRIAAASGADELLVCRLTASAGTTAARLRRRHADDPAGLAWHLDRAPVLERVFADAGIDDVAIATDDMDPVAVARAVARAAGWSSAR